MLHIMGAHYQRLQAAYYHRHFLWHNFVLLQQTLITKVVIQSPLLPFLLPSAHCPDCEKELIMLYN